MSDPIEDYFEQELEPVNTNPISLSFTRIGQIERMLGIPRERIACIDVETTGLDKDKDEILQVSICNGNGVILLNSYVRPEHRKRWPNATKINGITWSMVKDSPSLADFADAIEMILADCALAIGYNIESFDIEFLEAGGIIMPPRLETYDLINDCSVMFGRWNNYYGNYTYVSLEKVARNYGIEYSAHDSSQDVVATVDVFYHFLQDENVQSKVIKRETYEREVAKRSKQEVTERKASTNSNLRGYAILLGILFAIIYFLHIAMCSR